MRYAKVIGWMLVLGCIVCIVWLVLAASADASVYQDARNVRATHATTTRLARELREARHVESATRQYTHVYGSNVGRWVWLARDVGWPWVHIPKLMYVINRESGGHPTAKNPTSTATGLLQMLKAWWDGTWFGWVFNPNSARNALYYGWKAFHDKGLGWGPWAI